MLDKEALIANRVADRTEEVEIPGLGSVRIRALSRAELMMANRHDGDTLKWEQFTLSRAMVEPTMTESDVAAWQRASMADEINVVSMAVNKLSGIGQGADKSGVPDDGDGA